LLLTVLTLLTYHTANASLCDWVMDKFGSVPEASTDGVSPGWGVKPQLDIARSLFRSRAEGLKNNPQRLKALAAQHFALELRLIPLINAAHEASIAESEEAMRKIGKGAILYGPLKLAVQSERQLIEANNAWTEMLNQELASGSDGIRLFETWNFGTKLESLDRGLKDTNDRIASFQYDRDAGLADFKGEIQTNEVVLKRYEFEVVLADALALSYSNKATLLRQKAEYFSENRVVWFSLTAQAAAADRRARIETKRSASFAKLLQASGLVKPRSSS
jgi:hypothetical protein